MTEMDLFASVGEPDGSYDFNGHTVRTTVIDGEGWLVFADACAALGHSNPSKAAKDMVDPSDTRRLRRSDTLTFPQGMAPQVQEALVVNESGLYDLVFHSRVPSAHHFKKWVKSILRQLRETGVVDTREKPMTEMEMVEGYWRALQRNAEMEPKAEAYDRFMTAEGDYAIGTVAQMLGTGQNRLFARLRDEHVLITGGKRHNTPYQQYAHHFRVVTQSVTDNDGKELSRFTTYVKPSGVDFIRKVLKLQAELSQ